MINTTDCLRQRSRPQHDGYGDTAGGGAGGAGGSCEAMQMHAYHGATSPTKGMLTAVDSSRALPQPSA